MGCPAATWIGLFLGLEAALECPGSVLGTLVVVEDEAEKSSGGLSLPIACSSASVASFSVTRPDIDQPTTFLWNASIAAARQSHPSPVPMQAMSPISTVFARLCFLLALFACSPGFRMTAGSRFSLATMPSRLSSRLIRRYP